LPSDLLHRAAAAEIVDDNARAAMAKTRVIIGNTFAVNQHGRCAFSILDC
jgi:hypothetical protein